MIHIYIKEDSSGCSALRNLRVAAPKGQVQNQADQGGGLSQIQQNQQIQQQGLKNQGE
jgi:hypothetical protein